MEKTKEFFQTLRIISISKTERSATNCKKEVMRGNILHGKGEMDCASLKITLPLVYNMRVQRAGFTLTPARLVNVFKYNLEIDRLHSKII